MTKSKKNVKKGKQIKKGKHSKKAQEKTKKIRKFHLSYSVRLIFFIIIFVLFLLAAAYFFNKSIIVSDEEKINYVESSDLDYKVKLKDNDFYDTKVLGKNMNYIASLIDSISINFNYDFDSSKNITGEYNYEITGEVRILNPDNNEVFFTKNYNLLDKKTNKIENKTNYTIDENIEIDYDYYNELANNFKATYGIDTESNLIVSLKINRNVDDNTIKDNQDSVMKITIPLSQKAISINMDYDEINENGNIVSEKNIGVNDFVYLYIAIVLLLIAFYILTHTSKILMKLHVKSSKYDVLLKKIKKEYDRLIVDVSTMPNLDELNLTKIEDFNELLDLHDNYNEPIRYFEVTPHQKSYFFIKHDNEIFVYILKSVDLEK